MNYLQNLVFPSGLDLNVESQAQGISLYTSPLSLKLAREPDASGEIKDTLHAQPDGLDARLTIARSGQKAAQPGDQTSHLIERRRFVDDEAGVVTLHDAMHIGIATQTGAVN